MHQIVLRGKIEYLLLYICLALPIHETSQIIIYNVTGSNIAVFLIKYAKDGLVVVAILFFFLTSKDLFHRKWDFNLLDLIFIAFYILLLAFLVLPIGPATVANKLIYFKNVSMIGIMYFFGRNLELSDINILWVFRSLLLVITVAFFVVLFESLSDTHFQSMIGFERFQKEINETDPTGHYGLNWTFEAAGGKKRFASIMANPLAFAASSVMIFAFAFILYISSPFGSNRLVYFLAGFLSLSCLILSYSRSSFGAFFLLLIFIAFLFRYYRLILLAVLLLGISSVYIAYFAADDVRYYIIDTLSLADSSSLNHILEWLEAVDSITANPFGIGMATSGNTGGVEEDLKIGGENQFLVFGVQFGVQGMLLYILTIFLSIWYSVRAYFLTKRQIDRLVPFVAASFKFALLMPLFTANSENYVFTSFLSWLFVGYSVRLYQRLRHSKSVAR